MNDIRQGIVHIIGPEQGFTLPGMTIVCGDSHTATHGAFGALAFGIGTSEVEHVLATCLVQRPAKTMEVRVEGTLTARVYRQRFILAVIGKIGTAGGTGYVIEYTGSAIRSLSMEGRMTLCNMSIEAGARAGMVAPMKRLLPTCVVCHFSPKGDMFDRAVAAWKQLASDPGANSTKSLNYGRKTSFHKSPGAPARAWSQTSPAKCRTRRHADPRNARLPNAR